jgi:lipoprotein-anchoring transpeptidase ErfK/SrfK
VAAVKLSAVLASGAVLALAAPAVASAAAIGVLPKRSCYRSGQELFFQGTGFSPRAGVSIASDGASIGSLTTNPQGTFAGALTPALRSGERVKTYAATDRSNPAIAASLALRVSALDVKVRPRSGRPGRKVRLRARGFTNSETLYSHVVRGRYRRTVRVGRLKGACHTKNARKRVFSRSTPTGSYIVQFDGRRKYRKKTKVKVRYRVFVFKSRRRGRASAAAARWERLP